LWYAGYTQTYLERDLRNLSDVASLVDFQRAMSLAALRVGRLLNQSDLARDAGLPQPTCHRYLNLLETGYQIARLTNYTRSPTTGLVKNRKLMWTDCGIAAWLAGIRSKEMLQTRPDAGFWLEQTIYQVLQSWRALAPDRHIHFWRSKTKIEVDFVLEQGGTLVACEIKLAGTISPSDAQGLVSFCQEFGRNKRIVRGVLLHGGSDARPLGQDLWALPYGALL
jgi:predicted AAA+ superfamily ATPase